MGRPLKKTMSDGKREIISRLISEYDIHSVGDIEEALKDLLGGTIKGMMEAEMENQKEETQKTEPDYSDQRNGYKTKTVRSNYGPVEIDVPQDRKSDYEPKIVPKYSRDISGIDDKIIRMYAGGMSVSEISEQIEEIYGFDVSEGLVTGVTNKILPKIDEWQRRPLCPIYPIVFVDAIVFNVRDEGSIQKKAVYVIPGVREDGIKEVLSVLVGDTESAKFRLTALNELKNRGVRDILIVCADGLSGIKEAITAAFPQAEYQRCVVHMVRNTLKYVSDKDRKEYAADLKTIYHAPSEKEAYENMLNVRDKWSKKYPNSMKAWEERWDEVSAIFKFSATVRRTIYTTNAIESLNSSLRRLNKSRSVFPDTQALTKAVCLSVWHATKKWTMPVRNWGEVYAELTVMYPERLG